MFWKTHYKNHKEKFVFCFWWVFWFIYLFINFIGLQLLYNVVLVSTVQQSELAVCVHITPLFWLSFLFRSPQSTESLVLYRRFSFRSDQISCSVMSDSLRSYESQHTRPPCPSPTPGVHSDSRPSSQ